MGAAGGIYCGLYVASNGLTLLFLSGAVASLALGLSSIYVMLQKLVPAQAAGAGAGLMNGLTQAAAALSPLVIGCFIDWTGGYTGGLLYLVGVGVVGFACMLLLWRRGY